MLVTVTMYNTQLCTWTTFSVGETPGHDLVGQRRRTYDNCDTYWTANLSSKEAFPTLDIMLLLMHENGDLSCLSLIVRSKVFFCGRFMPWAIFPVSWLHPLSPSLKGIFGYQGCQLLCVLYVANTFPSDLFSYFVHGIFSHYYVKNLRN